MVDHLCETPALKTSQSNHKSATWWKKWEGYIHKCQLATQPKAQGKLKKSATGSLKEHPELKWKKISEDYIYFTYIPLFSLTKTKSDLLFSASLFYAHKNYVRLIRLRVHVRNNKAKILISSILCCYIKYLWSHNFSGFLLRPLL